MAWLSTEKRAALREKPTQEARLLYWFENIDNTIDPLTAWRMFGIYRLSAIVLKLRKKGHEIQTSTMTVKNHFGEDCQPALYEFKAPVKAGEKFNFNF